MPRLKNPSTGSVVNVSKDRAAVLTAAGYTSYEKAAKKTAAKSDEK